MEKKQRVPRAASRVETDNGQALISKVSGGALPKRDHEETVVQIQNSVSICHAFRCDARGVACA